MSAPVRIGSVLDELIESLRPAPTADEEIEHLDFDPRCQITLVTRLTILGMSIPIEHSRCEKPSAFICLCLACKARTFMCLEHYELDLPAVCGSCGVEGDPFEIFAFSPIRG